MQGTTVVQMLINESIQVLTRRIWGPRNAQSDEFVWATARHKGDRSGGLHSGSISNHVIANALISYLVQIASLSRQSRF